MAEIVLRQGARVAIDQVCDWRAGDPEDAADFAADNFGDFVITFAEQLRIGGAAGNLLDRVRRGAIVDFIAVGPWPVFNLADAAIVAGIGLALLSLG